jgi:hexosaminidase
VILDSLKLPIVPPDQAPASKTIELSIGDVINPVGSMEAYVLAVDAVSSKITITGNSPAGVFYAIQTLLSLSHPDGIVPNITVKDWPRFPYRGHMIDVSRNFHSGLEEIKTLLDGMSMYKLNRLHLHLGDDEGWRLEIPGLAELTQVSLVFLCVVSDTEKKDDLERQT